MSGERGMPVIPPRPDGGYPDEFFDSWGTDPQEFARWFEAYMAAADDHSDRDGTCRGVRSCHV